MGRSRPGVATCEHYQVTVLTLSNALADPRRNAQAIIPPRKNARAWKRSQTGAASRNEALRACHRLGRRIWKKWIGFHRRSLVETKMNCFKRLGERVMARTFERQVTELYIRVALLNRFSQLGRPVTVAVD